MEHLMLDIETLGTDPGAVILSIAAVEFELDTGKTGREFFWKIDLEDSVRHGFNIDPATLKWWLGQNPEVLKQNIEIEKGGLANSQVEYVMQEICSLFLYSFSTDVKVWGNSNRFDMGILAPYFKATNSRLPWKYSCERDVRTLVSFAPDIKGVVVVKAKEDGLDLHNPIIDCKLQIEYCSRIYNSLNHNTAAKSLT